MEIKQYLMRYIIAYFSELGRQVAILANIEEVSSILHNYHCKIMDRA